METPPEGAAPAPTESPVVTVLTEFLGRARRGELQSLIIGFVKVDGAAAIQSTPMSPVMMNHLSTLLERRVAREYDRALARANPTPSTGAAAVPETPRQSPAAQLPRKVRRQVAREQGKLLKKQAKKGGKPAVVQTSIKQWPSDTTN